MGITHLAMAGWDVVGADSKMQHHNKPKPLKITKKTTKKQDAGPEQNQHHWTYKNNKQNKKHRFCKLWGYTHLATDWWVVVGTNSRISPQEAKTLEENKKKQRKTKLTSPNQANTFEENKQTKNKDFPTIGVHARGSTRIRVDLPV